jgi:hypothetical protein
MFQDAEEELPPAQIKDEPIDSYILVQKEHWPLSELLGPMTGNG